MTSEELVNAALTKLELALAKHANDRLDLDAAVAFIGSAKDDLEAALKPEEGDE